MPARVSEHWRYATALAATRRAYQGKGCPASQPAHHLDTVESATATQTSPFDRKCSTICLAAIIAGNLLVPKKTKVSQISSVDASGARIALSLALRGVIREGPAMRC